MRLTLQNPGLTALTDLGRKNSPQRGVQTNGAADQTSARAANILVGNPETHPLLEITAVMPVSIRVDAHTLVAVTGAAGQVLVDGIAHPARQPLVVWPGALVELPPAARGLRTYLAVHGTIEGPSFLGSHAFDPLLGTSTFLAAGTALEVRAGALTRVPDVPWIPVQAAAPDFSGTAEVGVLPGPEAHEFPAVQEMFAAASHSSSVPGSAAKPTAAAAEYRTPAAADAASTHFEFTVSQQSDHVGLRLEGQPLDRTERSEILSRGVPVGTVEVPPAGEPIVLLRGRPLTAGYPIIGVVGRGWHDALGQLAPGDRLRLRPSTPAESLARAQAARTRLQELSASVATALSDLRFE